MKKIIILGNTEFAEELYQVMTAEGIEVVAFTVDRIYMESDTFCNLPMYPFESIEDYLDMSEVDVALALGYSQMNYVRKLKYEECKQRGYSIATFCSEKAFIYTESIGEGSIIMPSVYIGPSVEIGLCNVFKVKISLPHHNKVGNFNWFSGGCTFGGGTIVGSNCFLGLSTTVRNSICLADCTFAAANSYIHKNTLEGGAYMGMPAKIIEGKTSMEIIKNV